MYERIKALGKAHGLTIQAIEILAGLSNGTIGKWKTSTPKIDALSRVATVLKTSVDYLTTGEFFIVPGEDPDESIEEYLQDIKDNPTKRMMFDLAKDATMEEIKATVAFLKTLREQRD